MKASKPNEFLGIFTAKCINTKVLPYCKFNNVGVSQVGVRNFPVEQVQCQVAWTRHYSLAVFTYPSLSPTVSHHIPYNLPHLTVENVLYPYMYVKFLFRLCNSYFWYNVFYGFTDEPSLNNLCHRLAITHCTLAIYSNRLSDLIFSLCAQKVSSMNVIFP